MKNRKVIPCLIVLGILCILFIWKKYETKSTMHSDTKARSDDVYGDSDRPFSSSNISDNGMAQSAWDELDKSIKNQIGEKSEEALLYKKMLPKHQRELRFKKLRELFPKDIADGYLNTYSAVEGRLNIDDPNAIERAIEDIRNIKRGRALLRPESVESFLKSRGHNYANDLFAYYGLRDSKTVAFLKENYPAEFSSWNALLKQHDELVLASETAEEIKRTVPNQAEADILQAYIHARNGATSEAIESVINGIKKTLTDNHWPVRVAEIEFQMDQTGLTYKEAVQRLYGNINENSIASVITGHEGVAMLASDAARIIWASSDISYDAIGHDNSRLAALQLSLLGAESHELAVSLINVKESLNFISKIGEGNMESAGIDMGLQSDLSREIELIENLMSYKNYIINNSEEAELKKYINAAEEHGERSATMELWMKAGSPKKFETAQTKKFK